MVKRRLVVFVCTMLALVGFIFGFSGKAIDNMNLGLDLKGGFEILYSIEALESSENKEVDMGAVASAVSKRVDVLGVSEPDISVEGDRIRVQLAGISDIESARNVISSTAVLTFRDTSDNLLMDATVLEEGGAQLGFQDGKPVVTLKIKDKAKFAEVTKNISKSEDKLLVTWLDYNDELSYARESAMEEPAYISAATVNEELNTDSVYISGNFTEEEAQQLADLLNSGSLNFKMTEVYANVVSPDLGEGSFEATVLAGIIGIVGIMIFMISVYRFPGIISAVSIGAYTLMVLLIYTLLGGVFTLSGIAGLVLGVGMAVDSSVITFERVKDYLLIGRSVKQAYKEGSKNSFSTIFDSQLTTMISALILYVLGTGSVKGFATMLLVSTIVTVVFNVTIVRFLLGQIVNSGWLDDKKTWFEVKESDIPDLSKGEKKKKVHLFENFDFVKNAKYAIVVSVAILVLALGLGLFNTVSGNGFMNLGIDFSSGTRITLTSENTMNATTIEKDIEALGIEVDSVKLSGENNTTATVAIKAPINEEQRKAINEYSIETYESEASDSTVSPIVGQELVKDAIIMSILSWIGIMIYVSIRFKWDYAVSGIVALIHDVLVILAIFTIFRMEVTTDIIAVALTIIGYSINDSIVIFDRMRENTEAYGSKHVFKNEDYYNIVNKSLQETVGRSVITSISTIIPIIALLIFGSSSIFDFNIALMIGLLGGSISSIFMAAQLWYVLRCKVKPKKPVAKKEKFKKEDIEEYTIPGINDF